jgi:hypothetical protein
VTATLPEVETQPTETLDESDGCMTRLRKRGETDWGHCGLPVTHRATLAGAYGSIRDRLLCPAHAVMAVSVQTLCTEHSLPVRLVAIEKIGGTQ